MERCLVEMSSDAIQVAVAAGVTLATSLLALRAGKAEGAQAVGHTAEAPPTPAALAPTQALSPTRAPSPTQAPSPTRAPSSTRATGPAARPRILTGEPADAEQPKPAPKRAMRLVAGIAVLAVAGAFGLLAFVRALISMFDRIGG